MRYKKGSIVEVLSKSEVPSRSWRCAEIICGNGHNYTVKYKLDHGASAAAAVERVSRKSIRPCPPPAEQLENWAPGDVVEVLQNFSWKMAVVSKVFGNNCFLVRLVGSYLEFEVSKFDIRARHSWEGGKWFIIGKSIGSGEVRKSSKWSTRKYKQKLSPRVHKIDTRMNLHVEEELVADNDNHFEESRIGSTGTLKRQLLNCDFQVGVPSRSALKFRLIENEGGRHRLHAANPFCLPDKVDDKYVYTSLDYRRSHFGEVDMEMEKPSGGVGHPHAFSLEPNDADNITCSVASCSIATNDSFKLHSSFSRGPVEDTEDNFSDAESVYHWGLEEGNGLLASQEDLAAEVRRLELHAYRCTMEALHASGPLSWEQETMVTDLRISLHISNDEHLMELRNLISCGTSIPRS